MVQRNTQRCCTYFPTKGRLQSGLSINLLNANTEKIIKAKWFENGLRVGLLGLTAVTVVGLLKLNLQGPGLTEAVKDLWRPPPEGKPVRKYLPGFLHPNKE